MEEKTNEWGGGGICLTDGSHRILVTELGDDFLDVPTSSERVTTVTNGRKGRKEARVNKRRYTARRGKRDLRCETYLIKKKET